MDRKKIFLVILFVAIVAFVFAIVFSKNNKESVVAPQINNEISSVVEDLENNDEGQEQLREQTNEQVEVVKPAEKPTVTIMKEPTITPIRVEEATIVVEEEKFDPGIYMEANTNNIVITKEFKSQSRAKYFFEGFGIQKAPTK